MRLYYLRLLAGFAYLMGTVIVRDGACCYYAKRRYFSCVEKLGNDACFMGTSERLIEGYGGY